MKIQEVEEREGSCGKVFVYGIKITRNDGLEWTVHKRYSEISHFRDQMIHQDDEVCKEMYRRVIIVFIR